MKKSYLSILTLLSAFCGVGTAYAQEAETVSLSLGESATRITRGTKTWVTGLVGTVNGQWSLPSAASVYSTFGENSEFISGAGLYWGMCNGNNGNDGDFRDLTSAGFSFYGRQAYTGEYVAQVYEMTENASSVTVAFNFAGALATSSFSIWKISDSAAEMLTGSESSWTEGTQSFTSNSVLLSGERLVFIWNSNNAGQNVTISEFSASYTKAGDVESETLTYTLTDGAGNEYTGTFDGVKNVTVPQFTLPYNATITGGWENDVYRGTVNFPFPVSDPDGTKQAVMIRSLLGNSSFLYVNDDNHIVADPASATVPTEEKADNHLWYIYPSLNAGQFTFRLYNVGNQKYIPASVSSNPADAKTLVDEAEAGSYAYTATEIQNGAGFSVPGTQNYLSLNSERADGQNLFLWTKSGNTHRGSNLEFKDIAGEFAALAGMNVEKFDLIDGATVISPTEYVAPAEINAAIDVLEAAKTSCTTDGKKAAFLFGSEADMAKLRTFVASSESFGAPLCFTYTIKAGSWGTIFPHVNFSKPAEWTLYTCADKTDKGVLVLEEFTQGANKNRPYLVQTAATEDKTYQIIGYSNGAATANVTEGLLTGVIEENTVIPDNSYILVTDEAHETQAFHKFSSRAENTAELNSAFITLPEGAEAPDVLYILESHIPASISEVTSAASGVRDCKYLRNGSVIIVKTGVKYNVAGQRVK